MTTARVVTTIYACLGQRSRSIVVTTLAVVMPKSARHACTRHARLFMFFHQCPYLSGINMHIRRKIKAIGGSLFSHIAKDIEHEIGLALFGFLLRDVLLHEPGYGLSR